MDVNSRHNKINASYASCGYLHKSCYVNKGVHTVRKEIENCHKQNLGKEIQAFFCTVLQSDFKTCSQCLFRVRGLQEKCVCMVFFCFVFFFQRKAVRSGALEIQPISPCMWAYEVEVSRLPPAERPWGLLCSHLITVTEEGLNWITAVMRGTQRECGWLRMVACSGQTWFPPCYSGTVSVIGL